MSKIHICETVEEAIKKANAGFKPDAFGSYYHTFRIHVSASQPTPGEIVSRFAAEGWHLIGGPVQVAAAPEQPEHLIVSMLRTTTGPAIIGGNLRLEGELHGRIQSGH